MRFSLVIPVLNEELAVASTLRRALDARAKVLAQTSVDQMRVVLVNDGSTDRTQEIVDQFQEGEDELVKVRFPKNRGYGAAIKAGWQAADADLLGFIDGDGTCDPDFCVNLIRCLEDTKADVVLASRLNAQSRMPLIRKVGNILFARLLGLVSGRHPTDSASGFRVVRRSSLKYMSPLPDGLHFTPAMSAICLLDPRLKIEEVPMPYEERVGRSKLGVIRDGVRFLYIIVFAACCYAPIKTMAAAAAMIGLFGVLSIWILSWAAGSDGVATVFGLAAGLAAFLAFCTGLVCHQLNMLLLGPRRHIGPLERILQNLLCPKPLVIFGSLMALAGLAAFGGLSFASHNSVWLPLVALASVVVGSSMVFGGLIVRVIWAVGAKQRALLDDKFAVPAPHDRSESVWSTTVREDGRSTEPPPSEAVAQIG